MKEHAAVQAPVREDVHQKWCDMSDLQKNAVVQYATLEAFMWEDYRGPRVRFYPEQNENNMSALYDLEEQYPAEFQLRCVDGELRLAVVPTFEGGPVPPGREARRKLRERILAARINPFIADRNLTITITDRVNA